MKLTYWYSRCPDDSNAYSVRERTKKAALAALATPTYDRGSWLVPVKVTVEYQDAFDLMQACMAGGGWWEPQ